MKPHFKEDATLTEVYGPAMEVKTKEQALEYLQGIIDYCQEMDPVKTRAEYKAIVLSNIGYWTGYCDRETAHRVFDLYDTEHPFFGREEYSPEAILKAGIRGGEVMEDTGDAEQSIAAVRKSLEGS